MYVQRSLLTTAVLACNGRWLATRMEAIREALEAFGSVALSVFAIPLALFIVE